VARRWRDSSSHHHERADNDSVGLLQLDRDGSKVQGLDLGTTGLDLGSVFFFQKSIFGVVPLNQPIL
jgi:hypothetical protein